MTSWSVSASKCQGGRVLTPARLSNTRAPTPAYGLLWPSTAPQDQPPVARPAPLSFTLMPGTGFNFPNRGPCTSSDPEHAAHCPPLTQNSCSSLKTQPGARLFQGALPVHFPAPDPTHTRMDARALRVICAHTRSHIDTQPHTHTSRLPRTHMSCERVAGRRG